MSWVHLSWVHCDICNRDVSAFGSDGKLIDEFVCSDCGWLHVVSEEQEGLVSMSVHCEHGVETYGDCAACPVDYGRGAFGVRSREAR